ncbi:MAG TPA: AAA family ATPase [Egibacteraceae bacterium]|nr:AAA family ATPase [Egibacteraceae bacterium]
MATRRRAVFGVQEVADTYERIERNVESVVEGKPEVVRRALVALLAEGHLLLEDVPGVGKTLLAKAIARSLACSVRRVQFTPDLLPSDITGVTVFNQEHGDFQFKPGAVFANVVLGDEINRAGPKTQSALLEAMEERQVTVDGTTYELAMPFMVIATQNPIELEGTYPLPEAQRDRFLMRLAIGYPSVDAELEVLDVHGGGDRVSHLEAVADAQEVALMVEAVKTVHVADAVKRYIVDIVRATRAHPAVELGASPRASLALLRASRALAAAENREYVVPDDAKTLVPSVLAHRLILAPQTQMSDASPDGVLDDLLSSVPIPTGR